MCLRRSLCPSCGKTVRRLCVRSPLQSGGDQPLDYTAKFVVSMATGVSTGDDDQDVSGPLELLLRAYPIAGRPLVMQFVAEIAGGPDNNQDLYCIGTEWDFGNGMGVAMMPGCLPWSPDVEINRLFEIDHTYESPGTYVRGPTRSA